jgi:broad specificity phosphatase PhoE
MRRLLFIRHGETVPNAEGRMVSTNDPHLSVNGQRQAEKLADALSGTQIGLIITSPKTRCVQTTEPILRHQHPKPELVTDARLLELGFGPFEGLTPDEIEAKGIGAEFRAWRQGAHPVFPDGVEPFEAAGARLAPVYELATTSEHECVAIVGHSHALRILIATRVLSVGPETHRRMRLDHARVAEVQWEGDAPRLVGLNQLGVSSS